MLYKFVMNLTMISSLQLYSYHPSKDFLKTIGKSIDAILRIATDSGPDPGPDLALPTLLEAICCCFSADDVMFSF